MLDILIKGGILMIPLLFCSVLALAIIIEKFIALRVIEARSHRFVEKTRSIINGNEDNKIEKVLALCEMTSSPLARILKAGIQKRNKGKANCCGYKSLGNSSCQSSRLSCPLNRNYIKGFYHSHYRPKKTNKRGYRNNGTKNL